MESDVRSATAVGQRGFTLLEMLIALTLLSVAILALAPVFMMASERSAAGADMGLVGALAVEEMETLRAAPWGILDAGGSLVSDATVGGTPYFDASESGYVVRWAITDNATPVGGKRLIVRALALRQVSGLPKEVTLSALRVR
jgi:prepilin-type N-terminal cleavage/methylation domain-containing protein